MMAAHPRMPASPYGVPVSSVTSLRRRRAKALLPFEQTQLQYLLNQIDAAPENIKAALIKTLTKRGVLLK
jgi:hypothetical protein